MNPDPSRTTARRLLGGTIASLTAVPALLLVQPADASAAAPAAPATNGLIVFSDDRDGDREIFTINPDGTGLQQLTHNAVADTLPRWSPDGSRIAFVRDHALWTMSADGSDALAVVDEFVSPGQPTWSPDGTRLAYADGDGIAVVDADGSDPQLIAVPEEAGHRNEMPEWHPDGSKIAFLARMGPGVAEIRSVTPAGADAGVVVDDYVFTPRWSRDGEWLAYEELGLTTRSPDGEVDRIVFLNGSAQGDLEGLSWAPDQTRLTYAQRRHDGQTWTHPEIKVVDADGSDVQTLTPGWEPDWQPVLPPPDTTAAATVPRWSLEQPSVELGSDADGATFDCQVDGGEWEACTSPYVPDWQPGSHVLRVRAISEHGVADPTPAEVAWTAPYDDRQLRGKGFRSRSGDGYYRGTAAVTKERGATLRLPGTGATELALVATRCPGCGKVAVYHGKKLLKRVSLAAATRRDRVVVPVARWSSPRPAKAVRVVVLTSGKQVVVDGVAVR